MMLDTELQTEQLTFSHWPYFDAEEIEAVVGTLQSGRVNYWTGEICQSFEHAFAQYIGTSHGIAVANGTLALELALRGIEIRPGDEVIVPARTFIATASAVVLTGATPIVADIDPNSLNISRETIEPLITEKTKAIIVVHLAGWPCEMDPILSLAKSRGIKVIEDCAQAHGAIYRDNRVGSLGDIAAFSFCQDKIMTTGGEGGMVLTNHPDYFERMRSFKDHGKNFQKLNQSAEPGYKWLHDAFGSNYRLTEMQAVIGLLQLKKLPQWLRQRQERAEIYHRYLSCVEGIQLPIAPMHMMHAYYKYCFQLQGPRFNQSKRDKILSSLRGKGIPITVGFSPDISLEAAFNQLPLKQPSHPTAEDTARNSLMVLVHPTLMIEEVHLMASAIQKAIEETV